jgi:polar amino acid transport system substrate-binding protein
MMGKQKNTAIIFTSAIAIFVIVMGAFPAPGRGQGTLPEKLVVGTMDMPPFLMKDKNGHWGGLSVDLWQAVAHELGVDYEMREYVRIESILEDDRAGAIDVLPALPITEAHEVILDFSHQYFRSGLAIAISKEKSAPGLLRFAKRLVSIDMLVVVGCLLLLSLIAGVIVWLLEGRRNRAFDGGILKGEGNGLWWAVVTLTTVGYGDKAPQTVGGRMTALIWMFTSIVLIASFTAAITTTLTVGELGGRIQRLEDLPGVRVGAFRQSEGMAFLAENSITARPYESIEDGLQALVQKHIDAFVFNESVLKYMVNNAYSGRVSVLPDVFDHYYLGMGVPTNSPWREQINRALLKVIIRDEWDQSLAHYFGRRR